MPKDGMTHCGGSSPIAQSKYCSLLKIRIGMFRQLPNQRG